MVRTPIEAVALERMLRGGFLSGGLLEDVLLIALVDTGVPVWALDAAAVDGPLGIRTSVEGEPLGRSPRAADDRCRPAGWWWPTPRRRWRSCSASWPPGTRRRRARAEVTLFAIQVAGVPSLYVEEALWMCRAALEQP